jgi:hypothetical protein
MRFSRTRLSDWWFPHRDWLACTYASCMVKSPRSVKKAFGHGLHAQCLCSHTQRRRSNKVSGRTVFCRKRAEMHTVSCSDSRWPGLPRAARDTLATHRARYGMDQIRGMGARLLEGVSIFPGNLSQHFRKTEAGLVSTEKILHGSRPPGIPEEIITRSAAICLNETISF